jgi:hypothetical protein
MARPIPTSDWNGFCDFFSFDPDLTANAGKPLVSSDGHEAGDGPLYFFWPLPDGNAIRVKVCKEHAKWLKAHIPPKDLRSAIPL